MKEEERKVRRCRYSWFAFVDEEGNRIEPTPNCNHGGMGKSRLVDPDECETCPSFKSRYIEYPIVVNEIQNEDLFDNPFYYQRSGNLVRVRPCDEKYEGRTVLGLMLGDLPIQAIAQWNEETGKLTVSAMHNPAILVLESREVVWGYESWWSAIEAAEELADITDEQIMNQPYVKWFLDGE